MDNLTHTLVGVAISRGFFKKRVAYATSALAIAANLPDLDMIYSWPGIRTIEFHRGLLHSVWMLPVWAVIVAWVLRWAVRRWPPKREVGAAAPLPVPGFGMAMALGLAGVGSHVLLDWTNSYGIRLFAPFSQHWYALDLMPIWDPWVWMFLGAILGVPMLLSLITHEVGAVRKNPHRISGVLALLVIIGWVGLRSRQHTAALDLLNQPNVSGLYEGDLPLNWAAFPDSSSPYQWQAVIDLPSQYLVTAVQSPWDENRGRVRLLRAFPKPPEPPQVPEAERTRTAQIFLNFARFPLTLVEEDHGESIVLLTDMRFAHGVERPAMHVAVRLSDGQQVISQKFSWNRFKN